MGKKRAIQKWDYPLDTRKNQNFFSRRKIKKVNAPIEIKRDFNYNSMDDEANKKS